MINNQVGHLVTTTTSADRSRALLNDVHCITWGRRKISFCRGQEEGVLSLIGSQTHSLFPAWTLKAPSDWISWRHVLSEISLISSTCKFQGISNGPDTMK